METDINLESMAPKERLSIDISDLKERVNDCRSDVWWKELSFSSKLRVLILERLDQLETELRKDQEDK